MDRIVVVGAGLAGARAVEALRTDGFDGELTVVGSEGRLPYTRPPLSKAHLVARETSDLTLRLADGLGVQWLLGDAAVALDVSRRSVTLTSGVRLSYDGLVVATGSLPRPWPGAPVQCHDVVALRSLDDADRLRSELQGQARRIVVVGAGFIGGEIASSARQMGHDVALVEIEATPLWRMLGQDVGTALADLHVGHGVELWAGHSVAAFEQVGDRLTAVTLTNGRRLRADLCVLALGGVPDTAWLNGSGLSTTGGLLANADLSVVDAPGVVAAGDVVRWPHGVFGGEIVNVGHWTNAAAQGWHAARTLLAGAAYTVPFELVPSFWSSVHGVSIRSVGLPALGQEVRVMDGAPAELGATVAYLREGKVMGVVGINRRVDAFADWVGTSLHDRLELA